MILIIIIVITNHLNLSQPALLIKSHHKTEGLHLEGEIKQMIKGWL